MPLLLAPFRIPHLLGLCVFALSFLATIYQPPPFVSVSNATSSRRFTANRPYSITMSLSSKLSITDVNLKGEKVLIRVDFNVP